MVAAAAVTDSVLVWMNSLLTVDFWSYPSPVVKQPVSWIMWREVPGLWATQQFLACNIRLFCSGKNFY